ncbi:DUF6093 family protein [Streptomyces sp. AC495_CC817]|uniref:DUF6093 family protein n=1 Tax=Streptomyces sp. AC495_CC817 TaxID=2823900 RepID=UPI001C2657E1|nr:DUF6093 family protein [Streptomyces sp. AC495_CC817]
MALSRPPSPFADDWPDEILEGAREEFNGLITIRLPGEPGAYDPVTNPDAIGEPGDIVIGPRPARAQHLRTPRSYNDGNGWQTTFAYQFQCEILPGDPSITKGLVVTFSADPEKEPLRDPELAKMTYQTVFATNSSHAAVRTINCNTEGGRNG